MERFFLFFNVSRYWGGGWRGWGGWGVLINGIFFFFRFFRRVVRLNLEFRFFRVFWRRRI